MIFTSLNDFFYLFFKRSVTLMGNNKFKGKLKKKNKRKKTLKNME